MMAQNMKVNGTPLQTKDMAVENKFGIMEVSMKETGQMIKPMDMVGLYMRKEMCTTGNGKMIWHLAMVPTLIVMALSMMETGT